MISCRRSGVNGFGTLSTRHSVDSRSLCRATRLVSAWHFRGAVAREEVGARRRGFISKHAWQIVVISHTRLRSTPRNKSLNKSSRIRNCRRRECSRCPRVRNYIRNSRDTATYNSTNISSAVRGHSYGVVLRVQPPPRKTFNRVCSKNEVKYVSKCTTEKQKFQKFSPPPLVAFGHFVRTPYWNPQMNFLAMALSLPNTSINFISRMWTQNVSPYAMQQLHQQLTNYWIHIHTDLKNEWCSRQHFHRCLHACLEAHSNTNVFSSFWNILTQ